MPRRADRIICRQAAAMALCACWCAVPAKAQLRVASWNVTNYSSGRVTEFQTCIYGVFEGRSMRPDILIAEEMLSAAGATNFLAILNTAPGSPGDWAAAPFIDGNDTDAAFFYRTSKVSFLGVTVISVGGLAPDPPRNTQRYDVLPVGYTSAGATLACYNTHMKVGTASADANRRLVEAQRIRDNAETLTSGWHFLLGGDFNIRDSAEAAYQELIGSQPNNAGRFFDPINTPGAWFDNIAFRIVHTQDPIGASGMDDRHDQILVSGNLIDGVGLDYIGQPALPYSTTTWDDPNHTYRAWGNDGTSFNTSLTVAGNTMVGATIAQAMIDSMPAGGHLPVFLDLRVPAKVTSETDIDFGQVAVGGLAQQTLNVSNSGDVALWNAAGVAALNYSLSASLGFTAPAGSFSAAAGAAANAHAVGMNTSTAGLKSGTLTIASDAPDEPSRVVTLHGEVIVVCRAADANCDLVVNTDDVGAFVNVLLGGAAPCSACAGDTNGDSRRDGLDIPAFIAALP